MVFILEHKGVIVFLGELGFTTPLSTVVIHLALGSYGGYQQY